MEYFQICLMGLAQPRYQTLQSYDEKGHLEMNFSCDNKCKNSKQSISKLSVTELYIINERNDFNERLI